MDDDDIIFEMELALAPPEVARLMLMDKLHSIRDRRDDADTSH